MRFLFIHPESSDACRRFKYALAFEVERSAFSSRGLLTISALFPTNRERRIKFCFTAIILVFLSLQGCQVRRNSINPEDNSNRAENRVSIENSRTDDTKTKSKSIEANSNRAETSPRFDAVEIQDAAAVICDYYAAVNNRNYKKAYNLWSGKGEASGQTFKEFPDGFAETASVEIDTGAAGKMEGAAGSRYITIPVTLEAKTIKGETGRFAGEYVLRRSVVDGATAEQRAWRIYSADIKRR